jgi:hypothetical protein
MSGATDPKAVCLDRVRATMLDRRSISQSDPTPLRRPVLIFIAVTGRIAGHLHSSLLMTRAITASKRLTTGGWICNVWPVNLSGSKALLDPLVYIHVLRLVSQIESYLSSVVLVCNIRIGKHIPPTIPTRSDSQRGVGGVTDYRSLVRPYIQLRISSTCTRVLMNSKPRKHPST